MYKFSEEEVREACEKIGLNPLSTQQAVEVMCNGRTQMSVAEKSGISQPGLHKRMAKVRAALGLKGVMTVFVGQRCEFTGTLSQIAAAFDVPRRTLAWKAEGIRPESVEMIRAVESFIGKRSTKFQDK
ncbi:hypothetical protein KAM448_42310 [Aeromonas caviae]|uniref:Transcriptional regulator n=1 Tax=Aeromonas caviae TaxID=648 RepID=A0ABD0BDL2_AERCA|nr:hypothetical protein [Aeromonas caviae]GJA83704.1 hypothetical protein KAM355_42640 [Aeromonas caviae]GJB13766.1 hypothetical protein KAM362_43260 [Aeromonas caviae]GJB26486.1 hypothetical protein KAM365_42360 [Aeromonas caviae]GJB35157.1 hypothetical protein KAM367_42590 [Aeromonas caviae]GJB43880.1 hypothetical protein KAM369_43550 [Aeromonas caviae]